MSPAKSERSYWVFLADPEAYGWKDLADAGTAVWDGIKAAPAQTNLRKCRKGDEVLIYHTSPDRALIGIARITSAPRPDPADERRVVVDIAPVEALRRPVPLAELKADPITADMSFVRMPRVAVQPVSAAQWKRVVQLSGKSSGRKAGG